MEIEKDKTGGELNILTKESCYLATLVTRGAEVELRKLHIGSKLFGVGLTDVLKPRQRGPLGVNDIQVVHSQNCEKKRPR